MAFPEAGLEAGFRGFKVGLSFGETGGAICLELLARMMMLTVQPDGFAAALLIRFPDGRDIRFEGAPQTIQELQSPVQIQRAIHSPSGSVEGQLRVP
jgi:hypothetical protein